MRGDRRGESETERRSAMKVYKADRAQWGRDVFVIDGEKQYFLPKYDPMNHSPDGFEWGYGGSGPACLASSLARDATGCNCNYQSLKWSLVTRLGKDAWVVTEDDIRALLSIERNADHEETCPRNVFNAKGGAK
jgi:hypothetical protein